MRALVTRRLDGPDALELIEIDSPEPGPGQVRIAVAAAAVNPVDLATADGTLVGIGPSARRAGVAPGRDAARHRRGGRGRRLRGRAR
jgi:NADPH2:quinone reductase